MKAAYADPPYFGMGKRLYGHLHERAQDYDSIETHRVLVESLSSDYDAWALSLASVNLKDILPLCPPDARVAAWVKPFAVFKPNVNPAYSWEPVIFLGSRKRGRKEKTVRDWCSANIALKKGCPGAKPLEFSWWIFDLLGLSEDDEFTDCFPGSGEVQRAWELFKLARSTREFHLSPV